MTVTLWSRSVQDGCDISHSQFRVISALRLSIQNDGKRDSETVGLEKRDVEGLQGGYNSGN